MNAVKTLRSWSHHANCVAAHGRGPKLGIGNPVLSCLRPVFWLPCINRLPRFQQLVPCLIMMHKSPLTEFEEIFSNTFSGSGGRTETGQTRVDGGPDRIDGLIFESSQGQRQGQEQKGRQQRKRQGSHHVTTDAGDTAVRSPGLRVHESGVGTSIPTALASGPASTLHAGPQLSGEHNESASHASRDGAHGSSCGHGVRDASGEREHGASFGRFFRRARNTTIRSLSSLACS